MRVTVNIRADSADSHGVTPTYDLYGMAAHGEGNAAALSDTEHMRAYWSAAKLPFQRRGDFDRPAIVHVEPHPKPGLRVANCAILRG